MALIGCGVVGLRRLSLFKNKFKLIACADKNIRQIKKKINRKNILYTNNWKKILNIKNLDAIFIATYHSEQSKIIKEFLKKNINIFCEKPGGTSHQETFKLINILRKRKNKPIISFGYNHRFHSSFLLAKKILSQKSLGKILYLRAVYGHGGRKNYHKEWRFNKKLSGGGELIDKGSHLIDLSRLFLGDLKIHSAIIDNYFWNIKLDDNCFLILKNNKNNTAFLHCSSTEWKNKFLFEVFCKYGKIEINGLGKSYGIEKLTVYKMSRNMGIPKKKQYKFDNSSQLSWKTEINLFYRSLHLKKNLLPSLSDVYSNLKIINKVYQL